MRARFQYTQGPGVCINLSFCQLTKQTFKSKTSLMLSSHSIYNILMKTEEGMNWLECSSMFPQNRFRTSV